MRSALPWGIAAVAASVALFAWLRAPGEAVERPTPPPELRAPEVAPPDAESTTCPRATAACLVQLEIVQSGLRRCQAVASELCAGSGGEGESPGARARDVELARACEPLIDEAIGDHVERERDRQLRAREAVRSAFDAWAGEALELTDDEAIWLEHHVCAARALRQRTLEALDDVPPAEALEQLRAQRKDVLRDLEAFLGDERYQLLRSIGGVGLLADASECE